MGDVEFDVEFVKSAARKLVEELYKALALTMAIKDEIYENSGKIDCVGCEREAWKTTRTTGLVCCGRPDNIEPYDE